MEGVWKKIRNFSHLNQAKVKPLRVLNGTMFNPRLEANYYYCA
jgi:hypothetical protein